MKPNFALDLSHTSVALLHRNDAGKDGWNLVGEVNLDDPDMASGLAMLRKTAAELDQSGIACKLVIPRSQILFTELEAPGADDIAREVQIRKRLEGLTPYDVGELVFDWRRSKGKKVKVAVVARVTLQEAESFARENRMNPVSFVARPDEGFKGEVFFGMASGASALLGPGQTVEPDAKPLPKRAAPKSAPKPKAESVQAAEKPAKRPDIPPPPPRRTASGALPAPPPPARGPEPGPIEPSGFTPPQPESFDNSGLVQARATSDRPAVSAEEDARIAALLADVPDPVPSPEPVTEDLQEPAGEIPAPQTPAPPPAGPQQSAAKSAPAQKAPEPPVLAPFPPTLDGEDPILARPGAAKPAAGRKPAPARKAAKPPPKKSPQAGKKNLPPPPPRRGGQAGVPGTPPTPAAPAGRTRGAPANLPPPRTGEPAPQPAARAVNPATPAARPAVSPAQVLAAAEAAGPAAQPTEAAPATPKPAFSSRRRGHAEEAETQAAAAPGQKPEAKPQPPAGMRGNGKAPAAAAATPALERFDPPGGRTQNPPKISDISGKAAALSRAARELISRGRSAVPVPGQPAPGTQPDRQAGRSGAAPASPPAQGAKPGQAARAAPGSAAGGRIRMPQIRPAADRLADLAARSLAGLKRDKPATAPRAKPANDPALAARTAVAPGPAPAVPIPGSAVEDEAERLTLFGARKSQNSEFGKNTRYLGLVLTLVLLLALAVVALLSVFVFGKDDRLADPNGGQSEFAAAAVPEALLPQGQGAGEGGTGGQAQGSQTMTDAAAQARYGETGIWEKAPPTPAEPQSSRVDDLYIASIDPDIVGHDAVALPDVASGPTEPTPDSPLPPPPPGIVFTLDENGRVAPSRGGTLAPEGFRVFTGRPPEIAPERPEPPEALAPPQAPEAPSAPESDRPAPPALGIQPDESLREFRPEPRPASLIEENQRANNAGNTLVELAGFRPEPRPELTRIAVASIADAVAAAAAGNIAASPRPDSRPRDFASVAASDGSAVVAAAAVQTVIPDIPTRASVATQATMNNAIRLNKINLIGIYGSSASRRALVRLPSGRYVKVSVGERLDGGRVVSITDSQLIYTKNGRNQVLKLIPL